MKPVNRRIIVDWKKSVSQASSWPFRPAINQGVCVCRCGATAESRDVTTNVTRLTRLLFEETVQEGGDEGKTPTVTGVSPALPPSPKTQNN